MESRVKLRVEPRGATSYKYNVRLWYYTKDKLTHQYNFPAKKLRDIWRDHPLPRAKLGDVIYGRPQRRLDRKCS